MKRIVLSKRIRFSVFARDNFTCRYCGKQSDEVKLVVDHITPVCQGGSNDPENLITACEPCNQGKASKTIAQAAPSELDRLRILQEHQEQVALHTAALQSSAARKELRQNICNYYCDAIGSEQINRRTLSLLVRYAEESGIDTLFQWIDIAANKLYYPTDTRMARYISGIRRIKREEAENENGSSDAV